jgi:hypothetical protein
MNTKKIKLHDHHCNGMMPLRDPSSAPQPPASYTRLASPFYQGFASYTAHQQQSDACWPRVEYTPASSPRPAFPQSCVGSSTAAFYAAENLLGMAQFDCSPLGMFPPTTPPFLSSADSELYRPLDPPLMLRAADQSSSVRTYYVRPQRLDAAEIPLPAPTQRQQERAHHHYHGLLAKVSSQESPTSNLQSQMDQQLSARSLVSAPATASHAGTSNSNNNAAPAAAPSKTRWTQDLHERFVECVNQLGGADSAYCSSLVDPISSCRHARNLTAPVLQRRRRRGS